MSIWLQHGYGKGDKVDDLLDTDDLLGVILSPSDETETSMQQTVERYSDDLELLLDPQTYVWGFPDGIAARHASHDLEVPTLHWSLGPDDVNSIIARVREANSRLRLETLITPTCLQPTFADQWTGLAVQLAQASIAAETEREILVSVLVDEGALTSWPGIEEWLDVVTTFEVRGFYLMINRARDAYLRPWNSLGLTNLLRIIYRLSELNEYEVIQGYGDLDGLLSMAAGADGIGTGWYHTLRSFSAGKWLASPGGGRQRARATSSTLLTPLVADGEASVVAASQWGSAVFPDRSVQRRLATHPERWGISQGWLQHLRTVSHLVADIQQSDRADVRTSSLLDELRSAMDLYDDLESSGIALTSSYRSRLAVLHQALSDFRDAEL